MKKILIAMEGTIWKEMREPKEVKGLNARKAEIRMDPQN